MKENMQDRFLALAKHRITIIAALVIVLYTLSGFFLLPFLAGHYAPGMLSERLDSGVTIEKVAFNPFSLALEVREFRIAEPDGDPLVGFERLHVNFQLSSLFRWALTFRDVILDRPSLNLVIDEKGNLNLERLAGSQVNDSEAGGVAEEREGARPLRMVLFNVEINEARIDVADKRQSLTTRASLHPLTIHLADISTIPDREGDYSLTATGSDGTVFDWRGTVTLHPFRSEGELAFRHIPLETPWAFYRSMMNLLPPLGELSLETAYRIDLGAGSTVAVLEDLRLQVLGLDLQLEEAERSFLSLPAVALDIPRVDLAGRRVDGLKLAIDEGRLDIIGSAEGVLNIEQILRDGIAGAEEAESLPSGRQEDVADPGDPWHIGSASVRLDGFSFSFRDETLSPARLVSTEAIGLEFRADADTTSPQPEIRVADLALALKGFAVGFEGSAKPALQVDSVAAEGGSFDFAARSVALSRLAISDGIVDVIRHDDETLNLLKLSDLSAYAGEGEQLAERDPGEEEEPWSIFLEAFELAGFSLHLTDERVHRETSLANLENINLALSGFDGTSPFPFEADLLIRQGGTLKASGTIDPSAFAVEARVSLEALALTLAQPYLAQIADLSLTSGTLSTAGSFVFGDEGRISYKGQLGIVDLDVVENRTGETMLGWTRLRTPELRFGLNPDGVEMDSLSLYELKGKLIIAEDGAVNVVEAFRSGEEPDEAGLEDPAPEKGSDAFPVRIGRIALDKGTLRFADFSLIPQFDTLIHELKGSIAGVSSSPGARTKVGLEGRVDRYGTSKIEGEINVFDPREFTNMTLKFDNLEMTSFTPYSGKFAGRKIDSGRLSLDLAYLVEDSRLQSHNQVVIDRLVLGERVESPDAMSLPLGLAVALLRDANGVINIGLPITGSLDDPEFSVGHVIWQTFVNLITRMVSSPFRALGALLGAGDETLNAVLFNPGSGSIPPTEQEKLDTLLKALQQRPQLRLMVTGRYDPLADARVLRDRQVRRALAEASGIELAPGEDPGPVNFDDESVRKVLAALFIDRYGEEEYEGLMAEMAPAREEERGEPEADELEEVEIDPLEAARKLFSVLLEREEVTSGRLAELADERALAVEIHMTGPEGLPPERVAREVSEPVGEGDSLSVILDLDTMVDE